MAKERASQMADLLKRTIAKTPKRIVPEPTKAIEPATAEDYPAPPEVDPSEYSQEPVQPAQQQGFPNQAGMPINPNMPGAPTQAPVLGPNGEVLPNAEGQMPIAPEEEEKIRKRREFFGKWAPRFYEQFASVGHQFMYDKMNVNKAKLARLNELRNADPEKMEREALIELNTLEKDWNGFLERRQKFADNAKLGEEMKETLQEMVADIMEAKGVDMDPMSMVFAFLAMHNGGAFLSCLSDKLTHNHYF